MKTFTFFLLLLLSPVDAFAWDGDVGGVCCGGSRSWSDTVSRLADSHGADGLEAKGVFDDLVQRPYSDLFMIREATRPCVVYDQCGSLSGELIKTMSDAAMKQQEFQSRNDADWWRNLAAISSAVIALVALLISILTAIGNHRLSAKAARQAV